MSKQLADFSIDEPVALFALLSALEVRTTQQGKPYLALTLTDRSGQLHALKWEVTEDELKTLQAGQVVYVEGVKQIYHEQEQLKVLTMRPAKAGEPTNPADFLQRAPKAQAAMEKEVARLVLQITQAKWQRIVRYLLKKYYQEFFTFPAAKTNHHAFAGGLAYHSLSIVHLAQAVADQYDQVNRPLLYAASILHDLGKVLELSGPVATHYTRAGNLLGHIMLIDEQIVLAAQALKLDIFDEDLVVLRHTVLAHHGLLEYGSPVQPQVKEADILHQLDQLDASMQAFDQALAQTEPGQFSSRQWALDRRRVYHPHHD